MPDDKQGKHSTVGKCWKELENIGIFVLFLFWVFLALPTYMLDTRTGPAFNCRKIEEGDSLVAIDGVLLDGSIPAAQLLKGNDSVGSEVAVTVSKATTLVRETVTLRRMEIAVLAHKRKMFDTLVRLQERIQKYRDAKGGKMVEQVLDLWTRTMLEIHTHDNKCKRNIDVMQVDCTALLDELHSLLLPHLERDHQ